MDKKYLILDERMSRIEGLLIELRDNVAMKAPVNYDLPITTKQLCEYYQKSPRTITRWKRVKKIPYFRAGGEDRFYLKAVEKALGK